MIGLRSNLYLIPWYTEFIIFGQSKQLDKMLYDSIQVGEDTISGVQSVRNLGVYLDQELKMNEHVMRIVRTSYMNIRFIRSIRKCLSTNATKTIVQALVISRLDYCNSLLYGVSEVLIAKLQKIQNAAARLVLGLKKYDHITDALYSLHWLPVRFRIQYKIALITFKVLTLNEPAYLVDLLKRKELTRTLRSESKNLLEIPRSRLKSGGDNIFI